MELVSEEYKDLFTIRNDKENNTINNYTFKSIKWGLNDW